jgi:hypothetical protein
MDRSDYESARELMEQSLTRRERVLPPDHPEVAECLSDYARVLFRLGDQERSIEFTARALSIYEKVFGADHDRTVATTGQLAVLEFFGGDEEAAIALYARIRDSKYGTNTAMLDYLRRFPEFNAMEEGIQDRLSGG